MPLVCTFNQEKILVGAFSAIIKFSRTFVWSSSSHPSPGNFARRSWHAMDSGILRPLLPPDTWPGLGWRGNFATKIWFDGEVMFVPAFCPSRGKMKETTYFECKGKGNNRRLLLLLLCSWCCWCGVIQSGSRPSVVKGPGILTTIHANRDKLNANFYSN